MVAVIIMTVTMAVEITVTVTMTGTVVLMIRCWRHKGAEPVVNMVTMKGTMT